MKNEGHLEIVRQEKEVKKKKKEVSEKKKKEAEEKKNKKQEENEKKETEETRLKELKTMQRFTISSNWNTTLKKNGLDGKKKYIYLSLIVFHDINIPISASPVVLNEMLGTLREFMGSAPQPDLDPNVC